MSLRLRLFVLTVLVFVVGLTAAGVAMPWLVRGHLVEQVDEKLPRVGVAAITRLAELPAIDGSASGFQASLDGAYLSVAGPTGEPIAEGFLDEADDHLQAPDLSALLAADAPEGPISVPGVGEGDTTTYRAMVMQTPAEGAGFPIAVEAGEYQLSSLTVVAALPLTDVDSAINRIVLIEIGIGALLLALVAAGTWALIGVGLAPLRRMEQTAEQLTRDGFSPGQRRGARISHPSTRTEIGQLGATLNELFDEIDDALGQQRESERRLRQFVADASHELRTPLTSVRGYAELILRADGDTSQVRSHVHRIDAESERMTKLVEDLLRLARLDESPELDITTVDVADLAGDVVADALAIDPDRRITADVPPGTTTSADRAALTQVLVNLVTNARMHTPAASPIEVTARSDSLGCHISVIDHGRGIPVAERARVFDRFARIDGSRQRGTGGSGLGLAIVGSVVAAHRGTVAIMETLGGGATFTITLPPCVHP